MTNEGYGSKKDYEESIDITDQDIEDALDEAEELTHPVGKFEGEVFWFTCF